MEGRYSYKYDVADGAPTPPNKKNDSRIGFHTKLYPFQLVTFPKSGIGSTETVLLLLL